MPLKFEWDERKAELIKKKHGVTFEEASTIFSDFLSLTIPDPLHSEAKSALLSSEGRKNKESLLWSTLKEGTRSG